MHTLHRRALAVILSAAGAALAITAAAQPAVAASSATCTHDYPDYEGRVDGAGVNFRTGPSVSYASKGFLYTGDTLRIYCGKGFWYYTKLTHRSKSGLAAGTHGWIRKDMLATLAG